MKDCSTNLRFDAFLIRYMRFARRCEFPGIAALTQTSSVIPSG